jgi:hypothetical protein
MKALRFTTAPAIAVTIGCFSLAACGTTREPEVRTVEVKVPVTRACVPSDLPTPPTYADAALNGGSPPDERYRLTAQANQERKARLARTEPIITACR